MARHSASVPGRTNFAAPNSDSNVSIAGAGFRNRSVKESFGTGPSPQAASRIGRYPVQRHKLPVMAWGSHGPVLPGR